MGRAAPPDAEQHGLCLVSRSACGWVVTSVRGFIDHAASVDTGCRRRYRQGESGLTLALDCVTGLWIGAATVWVADHSAMRLELSALLAVWCGSTALLASLVFRVFEQFPESRRWLVAYGIVASIVCFTLLAALPAAAVIGSNAWGLPFHFGLCIAFLRVIASFVRRGDRWPSERVDRVRSVALPSGVVVAPPVRVSSTGYLVVKRIVDVVGSLVLSTVVLPFTLVAAAAVRVDSRGPSLYVQNRVGLKGRVFPVPKLRSMFANAEADGVARWAEENDPRVTRVGRVLRRTRIDELPQLLLVLRGEMSLVGPRPERPEFVDTLRGQLPGYEHRLQVKPGVTGWAQVRYRYGSSVDDAAAKLEYDLYYVENCSILLDLKILADTVPVVALGLGAR